MSGQRVALATGTGRGIGRAIAPRLVADGFAVAVNDLDEDAARRLADEIERDGGRSVAVPADVGDQGAVAGMVSEATAGLGDLDVMVCNAGIIQVVRFVDASIFLRGPPHHCSGARYEDHGHWVGARRGRACLHVDRSRARCDSSGPGRR
ncbi:MULTISPECIES: SDR family NAD(P)-dependent oxidoreductase [Streptomyces]|uniref:SDR family NAD(P)-dependent oxidoreductase n=1 Tax=Streptomyces TaxID=1883 RepID=UPI00225A6633|nr:SDR family NAD(P)-dependent oxidoreductase [Streptomyces sp. NBC_00268]MCX5188823.1 SDR family NAD(P)-dependent oxidoreductase [Streptomyces sp. NBC_00268]